MTRTVDANEMWECEYPSLTKEQTGMFGHAISRSEAHVLRLSMIYALLDKSLTIKPIHLCAALEVWRYCYESASYIFGKKTGSSKADRVLEALRTHPEGLSRTHISDVIFSKNIKAYELDSILKGLRRNGIARDEKRRHEKGRTAEYWFAVNGTEQTDKNINTP